MTAFLFGAAPRRPDGGTQFRLWAPDASTVELWLRASASDPVETCLMEPADHGFFTVHHDRAKAGWRYAYRVNGHGPFPDPASRHQPDGVHGWSEVVDDLITPVEKLSRPIDPAEVILYELHIGTFTPEGTYAAAAAKIPYLKELGVNTLSIMPLAEFPGRRNWGYDGVFLFAPTRSYGTADDLRAFIRACHAAGLAVVLDVVYNHFGPDGNYLWPISRRFFTSAVQTPWGDGVAIGHSVVASFFEENIRYWIREFSFDGFRLDAVHALDADHRTGFLEQLARAAREEAGPDAHPLLYLESRDNQSRLLGPAPDEYDAQWNDDYRYALHALLLGETKGVYADFLPGEEHLLRVLREGFAFQGEYATYYGRNRGSSSAGLSAHRFVNFTHSHDVPGNRPLGERLHHSLPSDLSLAVSVFTLLTPSVPMLFMGEEFQASTPFLYFTDHEPELGEKVRAGRLHMLMRRVAADHLTIKPEQLPDPQAESTFRASVLRWEEIDHQPGLACYKAALKIRNERYRQLRRGPGDRHAIRHGALFLVSMQSSQEEFLLALNTGLSEEALPLDYQDNAWQILLSTQPGDWTALVPPAATVLWSRPIIQ